MSNEKIPILIVDDEIDLLEIYQEHFEIDGFEVFTASSAIEAMEAYKNNVGIRIIISDLNMGKMSGIDLLKCLKTTYQTIPLFYLATGDSGKTEEYIKSLGGHGLVLKPFDLDEILIKIRKDLGH